MRIEKGFFKLVTIIMALLNFGCNPSVEEIKARPAPEKPTTLSEKQRAQANNWIQNLNQCESMINEAAKLVESNKMTRDIFDEFYSENFTLEKCYSLQTTEDFYVDYVDVMISDKQNSHKFDRPARFLSMNVWLLQTAGDSTKWRKPLVEIQFPNGDREKKFEPEGDIQDLQNYSIKLSQVEVAKKQPSLVLKSKETSIIEIESFAFFLSDDNPKAKSWLSRVFAAMISEKTQLALNSIKQQEQSIGGMIFIMSESENYNNLSYYDDIQKALKKIKEYIQEL